MNARPPCTGVILAGGQATRYGGAAKGLERVGGRRIVDRVADALSGCTSSLLVIANDPAADSWLPGVPCEGDIRPGAGGLGGIHAALVHAGTAVLVVAWDMPFVPPTLLESLRAAGETADAAAPESGSRRGIEPLCAYYAPSCLPAIERRLDAGDRRVIGFHEEITLVRLPAAEVARHGDPALLFLNVNSPDDLALAERHAAAADGGRDRKEE
ncbi:MAG TPA: molybdenum cofactor guanylyltransferase [Gemmatimonadaceae bacterium]|nr:molybdenum cofactor guanylyltransferase [Gemmatimonadaceae bacterium]